jgi:hypothetical protein
MSIVTILWTDRGAERAVDGNGYQYYFNRKTEHVKYWLCAQKGCNARMSTRISSSNLVGPNWPTHEHGTNILKRKAKEIQQEAIKKFASIPGTSTKMMMGDITKKVLNSANPNAIYGMSSGSSLKMALWKTKQKENPTPPLPKSYSYLMKTEIPENLSKTADVEEFLIMNSWTNICELESILVFMSNSGADIMKKATTWMMDGTFKICPVPFYQVC